MTDSDHMALRIGKPILHRDQLSTIEEQWQAIYRSRSRHSLFLSFEFISIWYRCFVMPEQVRVYPVYADQTLISFFPLFYSRKGLLRLLSWPIYADECMNAGILIADGYESLLSSSAIETLIASIKGWDILHGQGEYSFHSEASEEKGGARLYRRRKREPTYTIRLARSFDDYFNLDLSSKVRHNIRWWRKKLSQFSSHAYGHYTGKAAVALWPQFLAIEDSGWKGLEKSSIKKRAANIQRYYEELIQFLSERGVLHLYFLEIDGKPVAGGFGYIDGEVFHYGKIGYVEEHSSFSPSNLLLMHIIEDLIQHSPEVRRMHLFPHDYGYKHRYVNEQSYYISNTLYRRSLGGRLAYYVSILKERRQSRLSASVRPEPNGRN